MDRARAQLDGDGIFGISDSETSQSEASEPGSPLAAHWDGALRDARPSAASSAWSQDHVLEAWAAEEGQGEDENRQTAVNRMRAWLEDGNEALDLSSLSLTALPATLPPELEALGVRDNQFARLPVLPAPLRALNAAENQLTSLPADLPSRLRLLIIGDNSLTSLPALPTTLRELTAHGNHLTSLPELAAGLRSLNVDFNQLIDLPPLPATLEVLDAANNQLTSLPDLPAGLQTLDVGGNQLPSLPALPASAPPQATS
ncbi:hypothetical protein [Bradyrhizobium yuanmingense]|uniref:hypothetical protein n=1 Tax=Bradyrhizobium yuanmingense TaxID=108015 RepID=UPI000B20100E|nr:hypothetical protein [Bradyrhizobium yuanmingense]